MRPQAAGWCGADTATIRRSPSTPAAAVKLADALLEAATDHQVLVTTHSPDLLDHPAIRAEDLLAVEAAENGETVIDAAPEGLVRTIQEHLFTPGELLRLDPLRPSRGPSQYGPRAATLLPESPR